MNGGPIGGTKGVVAVVVVAEAEVVTVHVTVVVTVGADAVTVTTSETVCAHENPVGTALEKDTRERTAKAIKDFIMMAVETTPRKVLKEKELGGLNDELEIQILR